MDQQKFEISAEIAKAINWREGDQIEAQPDGKGGMVYRNVTEEYRQKIMNRCYQDVTTFMNAAGHITEIGKVDVKLADLYLNLIKEEYEEEFTAAVANHDRVEEIDAIFDTIWVLIGRAKAMGYDFEGAWGEGARSNLAKIDPVTGKCIRREDGKILKPEGWTPPDFKPYA